MVNPQLYIKRFVCHENKVVLMSSSNKQSGLTYCTIQAALTAPCLSDCGFLSVTAAAGRRCRVPGLRVRQPPGSKCVSLSCARGFLTLCCSAAGSMCNNICPECHPLGERTGELAGVLVWPSSSSTSLFSPHVWKEVFLSFCRNSADFLVQKEKNKTKQKIDISYAIS